MTEEKKEKEKVELTPEQKAERAIKRQQDDLAMYVIAFAQKDDKKKNAIFDRIKGKLTPVFLEQAIKDGDLTKKQAETLTEMGRVGAVRTGGVGKGKTDARPWRWQIDTPKDGPTGKALIALETSLSELEKNHKSELALISKWYKDNENVDKAFSTYFAKVKVKEEKTDGKEKGK